MIMKIHIIGIIDMIKIQIIMKIHIIGIIEMIGIIDNDHLHPDHDHVVLQTNCNIMLLLLLLFSTCWLNLFTNIVSSSTSK